MKSLGFTVATSEGHFHQLDLLAPLAVGAEHMSFLAWLKRSGLPSQLFGAVKKPVYKPQITGAVAILPIMGWLSQRGGGYSGTSTQQVSNALNAVLANQSIKHILLEIDSIGGSAYGIQELADEIYAARNQKRITAIANSVATAGAYWIGSQAHEFFVTPGGQAGGIGIYRLHENIGPALDKSGVKITTVSAGKYKTEGNNFEPLSNEARKYTQEVVNKAYSKMACSIARGRGVRTEVVTNGMGKGRTVGAAQAVKERMADGVMSMSDLIDKLTAKTRGRPTNTGRTLAMLH